MLKLLPSFIFSLAVTDACTACQPPSCHVPSLGGCSEVEKRGEKSSATRHWVTLRWGFSPGLTCGLFSRDGGTSAGRHELCDLHLNYSVTPPSREMGSWCSRQLSRRDQGWGCCCLVPCLPPPSPSPTPWAAQRGRILWHTKTSLRK